MSGLPYWSLADGAELDVLLHAFVQVHARHVPTCAVCSGYGPWCQRLRDSFDAVLEWREGRELRSKATYLRLRELERERMPGRVHIVFNERGQVIEYELVDDEAAAA